MIFCEDLVLFDALYPKPWTGKKILLLGFPQKTPDLAVADFPWQGFDIAYLNPTMQPGMESVPFFESMGFEVKWSTSTGEIFDVVLDYGASDNIDDLYTFYETLHHSMKPGATLFSANAFSLPGNFPGRSWYRGRDFWKMFSEATGHSLVYDKLNFVAGDFKSSWLVYGVCVKGNNGGEFITHEVFDKLPFVREKKKSSLILK